MVDTDMKNISPIKMKENPYLGYLKSNVGYLLLMVLLWSSVVLPTWGWDGPTSPAFQALDKSYVRMRAGTIELINMPPAYDYCGIRLCYAMVAAIMLDAENCRVLGKNCRRLSDEERFSALDLSRFRPSEPGAALSTLRSSYAGLNLNGGNPHDVVQIAAFATKGAASEACASVERISGKMRDRGVSPKRQNKIWRKLAEAYESYRGNTRNPRVQERAIQVINQILERDLDAGPLRGKAREAVQEGSTEKFFEALLGVDQCQHTEQMVAFEGYENAIYKLYPHDGQANRQDIKQKIREVLEGGRPVALTNICISNDDIAQCHEFHAVVISGMRQMCRVNEECRDSVKVINAWGDAWQARFDGGWVDADVLLSHTKIQRGIMGWFADRDAPNVE